MTALNQRPNLGVLGGMGPLATVNFLEKLARHSPAAPDQDPISWISVSPPAAPERSEANFPGTDEPLANLVQGARWLAGQGVELIAVPCNNSHFWHRRMQAACPVPILHIGEVVAQALRRLAPSASPVAVLATRATLHAGVYGNALRAHGFTAAPLDEEDQAAVDAIIRDVRRERLEVARRAMRYLLKTLEAKGIARVVLGCTELPLALPEQPSDLPAGMQVVDSSLALARACIERLASASSHRA